MVRANPSSLRGTCSRLWATSYGTLGQRAAGSTTCGASARALDPADQAPALSGSRSLTTPSRLTPPLPPPSSPSLAPIWSCLRPLSKQLLIQARLRLRSSLRSKEIHLFCFFLLTIPIQLNFPDVTVVDGGFKIIFCVRNVQGLIFGRKWSARATPAFL